MGSRGRGRGRAGDSNGPHAQARKVNAQRIDRDRLKALVEKAAVGGLEDVIELVNILRPDVSTLLAANPLPESDEAMTGEENPKITEGTQGGKNSVTTKARFSDLDVHVLTKKAIREVLGYELCTEVQRDAIPPASRGSDVMAKAKTGTGKTIAFLVPAIDVILRSRKVAVGVLVISPTRELAMQICTEAKKLVTFHEGITVNKVIGGTNQDKESRMLNSSTPNILVATPGRLMDHMQHGLTAKLQNLEVLILDEADQLLEMGFRKEIEGIISKLPRQRQSLLFSATMPPALKDIMRRVLRSDHVTIDTVPASEEQTHLKVLQQYAVVPMEMHVYWLVALVTQAALSGPYKIMCFFPTARIAGLMAEFFTRVLGFKGIVEMHSRKSQAYRTKAATTFRNSQNVIMMTSDVSARGLDYPEVSLVIQCGATTREQYIHRIGRTGRGGAGGGGFLLLCEEVDKWVLPQLKDLPLQRQDFTWGKSPAGLNFAAIQGEVDSGLSQVESNKDMLKAAHQAYASWLGYYRPTKSKIRCSDTDIVSFASSYAQSIGVRSHLPPLARKTVGKMGLKGVPGLNVVAELPGY